MKTDVIAVSGKDAGMDAALALTDSVAADLQLSHRDALHLRLLAEEMMNLMRAVIGQLEGRFWIETEGKACRLYLQMATFLDAKQRAQLIAASTSGKNEAHRGIMGKIRAFFEPLPIEETPVYLFDSVVPGSVYGDLTWSMNAYRENLRRNMDAGEDAREEWDELEKSVVSHVADNVQVSIRGYDAELMILKNFG